MVIREPYNYVLVCVKSENVCVSLIVVITPQGDNLNITPLRCFMGWLQRLEHPERRNVATLLEDALLLLGESSLRQRSPFIVSDVHET